MKKGWQIKTLDEVLESPRWPNSSGSSGCWTKRLRASPPPKPTPKRTSKTPAPSSKATSNPSSPSAGAINTGWVENFLHAPQSQVFLAKHAKGAIMAGLNMGLIQQLPVMLPPIKVQAAIIEAADSLHEQTHHLARIYEQKLAALDALKKSLLHQAFAGEL
jgi:hypothetical protein